MKKKTKNTIICIVAAILTVILVLNFVGCTNKEGIDKAIQDATNDNSSSTDINNPQSGNDDNPAGDENNYDSGKETAVATVKASLKLASNQPYVGASNLVALPITVDKVKYYNVGDKDISIDNDIGIKSYKTHDLDVEFDTSIDQFGVMDTIFVDGAIELEQNYAVASDENSDLVLSEIYADYYEVEVDYTDNGKVSAIYYYDTYYSFVYNAKNQLATVFKNADEYKTFEYNAEGNIIKETIQLGESKIEYAYSYLSGTLYSKDGVNVNELSTTTVSDIVAGKYKDYQFEYAYTFEGNKYLTKKTIDGVTTTYSYIGDRVVEIDKNGKKISYILDNGLDYVGLKYGTDKYYFAVDPFGNVMGLMDCEGNYVVRYEYDIWGNLISVTGDLADTLGKDNEILKLSGIYDFTNNVFFFADTLYLPEFGKIVKKDGTILSAKNMYEWEQDGYFDKSAVTAFSKIHDKVVDVAVDNLKEQGLDVTSHLYAVDINGISKRLVDIYTLDFSITPFSAMNLLNGNQIYEVIYHAPESKVFEDRATKKLSDIINNFSVSYFADYEPDKGTMSFHGQFVYLGYLIDYKCVGNGIVEYQVLKNKKEAYDTSINIFDYDSNKYVCYVNNTFDLNFLDGVTIIPGISRETFDAIDGYLSAYMQTQAGYVCDQMLIYDDPAYYDAANMNVRPDYWAQMNLGSTTSYLEIQADGTVKAQTMPVWETDGFRTKLLIGAGVILVTAVLAVISVVVPGGCVIASICIGAAKGALVGALSGFAFGAVTSFAGTILPSLIQGETIDWNNVLNKTLDGAIDGFMTGAITGAIMGGVQGALKPTYCFEAGTPVATAAGSVAIENVAVGDQIWSYDYVTGTKSLKTVTGTSVRQTNELLQLTIGDETIVTTPEHPFYAVNSSRFSGYTAAGLLSQGDCILTADGSSIVVENIASINVDKPIAVYNLTVAVNHSYYVSIDNILVHNGGCQGNLYREAGKGHTGRFEPKDLTEKLVLDEVKADPLSGTPIKSITMGDKRWPASDGWIKMQKIVDTSEGKINVHYVMNTKLGLIDDFKFKSSFWR